MGWERAARSSKPPTSTLRCKCRQRERSMCSCGSLSCGRRERTNARDGNECVTSSVPVPCRKKSVSKVPVAKSA
eukprot:11024983-Lingulodinium_polyedra.AAC.1